MATLLQPMIMAGDEFALPDDFPSNRLDPDPENSIFNAVGALEINSPSGLFTGSAVALSPEWILTAAHNVDINANGLADPGIAIQFHLPGIGSVVADAIHVFADFTGFASPAINDDLALLHLSFLLPTNLNFPTGIAGVSIGDELTLVGFGRSGFGSFGFTSDAGLTDRRIGYNLIDAFESDDEGSGLNEVFVYDFDSPSSPDSLGNDRESMIGPGDSGGAAFVAGEGGFALAGINTFTDGIGGRFGDLGGGVLVEPYLPWIRETTDLYPIPEPTPILLLFLLSCCVILRRCRKIW